MEVSSKVEKPTRISRVEKLSGRLAAGQLLCSLNSVFFVTQKNK
jgi:hypothetical protein